VALRWSSNGFSLTDACTLQLFAWRAGDAACTNHTACAGSSSFRMLVAAGVPNTGSLAWKVPGPFHVALDWLDAPLLRLGCECEPGVECAHAWRGFAVLAQVRFF
jgi:hypothetical protein